MGQDVVRPCFLRLFLQKLGHIADAPMFDIFSIPQADDIDDGDPDLFAGWRNAHDLAGEGSMEIFPGDYEIVFGYLVGDLDRKIGQGLPEQQDEAHHSIGSFRHSGKGSMIDHGRIHYFVKGSYIALPDEVGIEAPDYFFVPLLGGGVLVHGAI